MIQKLGQRKKCQTLAMAYEHSSNPRDESKERFILLDAQVSNIPLKYGVPRGSSREQVWIF